MLNVKRPPPLTGLDLRDAMQHCEEDIPFLVNELLSESGVLMLAADGATGKTTVTMSAVAAMTSGSPVFGQFPCARPLRVVYVMGEGDRRESLKRLKRMHQTIPADAENLWIIDAFAGSVNVLDEKQAESMIRYIAEHCPRSDVVILDPIYPFVVGGLSEDRVSNGFARFITLLRSSLSCAVWLNHHNTKTTVTSEGKEARRDNPYYGGVWLFNMLTAQYTLERIDDRRTVMRCKKDRFRNLFPVIPLLYDLDADCVTMYGDDMPLTRSERVNLFLRQKQTEKKPFTLAQLISLTGVSHATFFRLRETPPWTGKIRNVSSSGREASYVVDL